MSDATDMILTPIEFDIFFLADFFETTHKCVIVRGVIRGTRKNLKN